MKRYVAAMLLALALLCAAAHAEYVFEDGYRVIAGQDGKYGLENQQGEAVLPPVYDEIGPFETWPDGVDRCWLIQDGKYGWYPSSGGGAAACAFDWQPECFSQYLIYDEQIWNLDGSPAGETLYAWLTVLDDFHLAAWEFTGTAREWQELGDGWGGRMDFAAEEAVILDENLQAAYTLRCDFIDPASEGLCAFMDLDVDPNGETWDAGYIDVSTGEELCRKRTSLDLGAFQFGYARTFQNGTGGANLIDRSFEKVLPRDYDWITNFTTGVKIGEAYALLCDTIWEEKNIAGYRCTLVNEELEDLMTFDIGWDTDGLWCNGAIIVNDGDYGLYYVHDMQARLLLKGKYVGANTADGLVRYQSEAGLWGYISDRGENVIPAQYLAALDFSDGYGAVQGQDGKWSFLDVSGRNFFETSWDYVESFRDGYAYVCSGSDGWMINTLGEKVRPKLAELCSLADAYNPYVPAPDWSGEIAETYAQSHGLRIFKSAEGKYGVMDGEGNILAPGVYDHAEAPRDYGSGEYRVLLKRDGRWGWVSADSFCDARWAKKPESLFAGLTIVCPESDDWFGEADVYRLVDADGNAADGVDYACLDVLDENLLAMREAGSGITFVVDGDFRQVFSLVCDEIAFAGQNRFAYRKDGLWGLCDPEGQILAEPAFSMRFHFADGYAVVVRCNDQDGEEYGLLNRQGDLAIPFGRYELIYGFKDGYCIIRAGDHSYPDADEYGSFIRPWHDYIILDTDLNTCAQFTGNCHDQHVNNLFIYFDREEDVLIDAQGNELLRCENLGWWSNGYCRYQQNGLYGFLDERGSIAIPAQYKNVGDFSDNGLVAVQDEAGWRFINAQGETAFTFEYSGTYPGSFYDGYVSLDAEWYINEEGAVVGPLDQGVGWF